MNLAEIIFILIVFGGIGGLLSSIQDIAVYKDVATRSVLKRNVFFSVFVGVAGALVVPSFVSFISILSLKTTGLFGLVSLALLAGYSSPHLIERMSSKIVEELKSEKDEEKVGHEQ